MLVYSHWTKEDVYKVLITLNVYVGRYRSQGRFALEGDMLDWGRCIHVQHDADEYDVVHWIERLQATPPTRRKSKARFQLQALLPRR
ncbi:uncharacterized protein EI97DRAFT_436107 [Westerdykella ornata]|uniref:Uncharacterized protein n=1 Tax=Westerdykella ornata TaxID=318751 RepID=A0A6A6JB16_WESOR|nr:uncharacterized protein EI97DRAFT_436107 [Westerdykella ornata]KAF2273457.1 hypothetical protein EI97DRAFT_436107 [Westerdykella ornata]